MTGVQTCALPIFTNRQHADEFCFKARPIDSNNNVFEIFQIDFENISMIDGIPEMYNQSNDTRSNFKARILDAISKVTPEIKSKLEDSGHIESRSSTRVSFMNAGQA